MGHREVNRFTVRPLLLDALYLLVVVVTAPWWMAKARSGWPERFGRGPVLPATPPERPRLLIHAVSLGEINACRPLIGALGDDLDIVVSASTDTGLARAQELYADRCHVVRYPLDASWAVRRFLNRVRPSAVALVELELWPTFIGACDRRSIPVGVINGRLSARSFKGYRKLRWFLRPSFASLAFAGVQDEEYRERFIAMGVAPDHCSVVGNTKWDVHTADTRGAEALAQELGIDPAKALVVGGSTAPGEDELLRASIPDGTQLLCAPRRPEWRDEAFAALDPCVRRSQPDQGDPANGRFLLDTMGELSMAYALADIVVVGRSFVDLHGSDPMEPAALGKPVLIGPAHEDFKRAVHALHANGAIVITDKAHLAADLKRLLSDPEERDRIACAARETVAQHAGASRRYAALVRTMLDLNHTQGERAGA